jgi:hypothetical protein
MAGPFGFLRATQGYDCRDHDRWYGTIKTRESRLHRR